jgi:hypothetical protein
MRDDVRTWPLVLFFVAVAVFVGYAVAKAQGWV